MTSNWLPIADYSTKHKVSISTLRRKIKTEEIKYRFIDGKYLLMDEPLANHQSHRPSPLSEIKTGAKPEGLKEKIDSIIQTKPAAMESLDGPILSAANRLLTELKKAYAQILQEKEEQILQLKEEVIDLKTLVRVLENENDKLNARLVSPKSIVNI
jgi:hypothetical protein